MLAALALGAVPASLWFAFRGAPPPPDALITWLVFLALGLAWTGLARGIRRATERDLALALVPGTFLALAPFAPLLLVVVSATVLTLADGLLRRRTPRAISLLAAGSVPAATVAALVAQVLVSRSALGPLDSTLGSVLAGLLYGVIVHLVETQLTDRSRARRPRRRPGVGLAPPVQVAVTACAAGLLASSWTLHPLLIVVAAIPLTLLLLVVIRLESDHRALALSRAELSRIESRLARSEKLSALGQLASAVAHELNNPLASVIAAAELLETGGDEATRQRLRERVLREARRASLIVSELLAFSRDRAPRRQPCSPTRIVDEVIQLREEECRRHGIRLTTDVEPGLPAIVADGHQLVQLLLNLVTNAEHAIRSSGRGGEIALRVQRNARTIVLSVSDDGPGIPRETAERVFDPFFTTKKPGEGTGLGLAICADIAQEHGGTIDLVSRPERGTLFTVRLPLIEAGDAEPAHATAPTAPAEAFGAGRRALVADDEEGVREVLAEALSRWGFEVVTADSVSRALSALAEARFDLGLVDRQMPQGGGLELIRRAEATGRAPAAVIFVSGEIGPADGTAVHPTLAKPFTLERLREEIESVLVDQRTGVPSAV